jgi:hypothetical protein
MSSGINSTIDSGGDVSTNTKREFFMQRQQAKQKGRYLHHNFAHLATSCIVGTPVAGHQHLRPVVCRRAIEEAEEN